MKQPGRLFPFFYLLFSIMLVQFPKAISEVNDTDRDDVDSSYTSQFKQHNRSSLASSYFTFFYPCFFHLLKSSFVEKIRSTMGIIG